MYKRQGEGGSLAQFAFGGDGPAHQGDDVLRDGQSEPGSLDAFDGVALLALEGMEEALHEGRRHADARVGKSQRKIGRLSLIHI